MTWFGVAAAVALIGIMLLDTFEAILLPRSIRHAYRLARLYYQTAWRLWRALARLLPAGRWRHGFLSIFGPLSLIGLMIVWAAGLIYGFALLHWSLGTSLATPGRTESHFATYLYL